MKKNGFTLVEILIVCLIGGALILLAVVSLNGIQSKGRDAERINDINSIHKAMMMLEEETGSFLNACGGVSYVGAVSKCDGQGENFELIEYLDSIVAMNDPLEKVIVCDAQCSVIPCNYAFNALSDEHYEINFYLERATADYNRGCHRLTEKGIE